MKILLITSEYGRESGGLSYGCFKYSNLLIDLGHKIVVASSVDSAFINNSTNDFNIFSSHIRILEGGYKKELNKHLFFKAHLAETFEELKTESFDLVVSFGAGENGFFASELSARFNAPLLLLLRGSEINLSISDMELRQKNYIALSRASAVIGLSNELILNSKEIYYDPRIKYMVIPIPIQSPQKLDINLSSDKVVLGCGAHHINEKKGIANLITAIAELKNSTSATINLEVVGKIDSDLLKRYNNLINDLGLKQQVNLLGELTRNEFLKRMRTWDLYIQTSFGEGFSNSVAEYISLGKAFLLSKTGFIAEALSENFQSIILDSFSPKNISKKIHQLLNNKNPELYYQNAFDAIISKTNEEDIREKWDEVLAGIKGIHTKKIESSNMLSIVFHDISIEENSNIDVPLKSFESFVESVSQKGYLLCSSSNYFKSHNKSNLIVCTFDDGYENLHKYALPILNKYSFTATVFICVENIGCTNKWNFKDTKIRKHLTEMQLQDLKNSGWEIGSHGLTHNSLLKLTDKELQNEIYDSKKQLESIFGQIESYAYPYGDFNEYIKMKVAENYNTAYSLTKGGTLIGVDNHQIRRYFLSEFNLLLEQ
ncbi:MAG: polysaccharide deacetylase family protein [Labilibaculum sp.]|nr:polysaccharide deacetylase family protein [Labilibaculum sp.]MBI9060143.1 polysaccharide deacetylase family protein [Labilibaculum sp.]